jgi:pyridoxamine 5'-phosphate oxidase
MKEELRALKSLAGPFPTFDAEETPGDPRDLFSLWLREAIEAGIREPHAMTLSTVDPSGAPDARVLILKNLDERGFHFATSSAGPKGRQLALNPYVAATFYWSPLGRQIRIRGIAIATDAAERDADFRARATGSRAVALLGRQSEVLASDAELYESLERERTRLAEKPDLVAPHWAVFLIMPHEIEFWQGDEERRHRRLRYRRDRDGWLKERLWP